MIRPIRRKEEGRRERHVHLHRKREFAKGGCEWTDRNTKIRDVYDSIFGQKNVKSYFVSALDVGVKVSVRHAFYLHRHCNLSLLLPIKMHLCVRSCVLYSRAHPKKAAAAAAPVFHSLTLGASPHITQAIGPEAMLASCKRVHFPVPDDGFY